MLLWVRNVVRAQLTTGQLICSMKCWVGGPLVVLSWWTSCFGGSTVSATSTGSLSSARPWSLHGVFTCHVVALGAGGKVQKLLVWEGLSLDTS